MVRVLEVDTALAAELSGEDLETARQYAVGPGGEAPAGVHEPARVGRPICSACWWSKG